MGVHSIPGPETGGIIIPDTSQGLVVELTCPDPLSEERVAMLNTPYLGPKQPSYGDPWLGNNMGDSPHPMCGAMAAA